MKDFDLSKLRFGDSPFDDVFAQGQRNAALKKQNDASLTQLVEQGIITEEQKIKIGGCAPERADYHIKKLQELGEKPSPEQYDQIDAAAGNWYFKKNQQEQAARIPAEETSPEQVGRKKAWLAELGEKARQTIPPRSGAIPQLSFDENGGCTREHVIESLKAAGLYNDNLYVRIFRSADGLQNALNTGTDCSPNAPMLTTGADGEDRAMREHGINDRSMVTFAGPLKNWHEGWKDGSKKSSFGDAIIVFRGEALAPLRPSWNQSNSFSNGFSAFVVPPREAVVAVFHANAPHKAVPTIGKHTCEPEPPIKGAELPRDQQPDLPS